MKMPIVSVVMPVFNGEEYLREAIESILHQTFTDFEFIIINDGSTDKSEEIIISYDDSRIRYVINKSNINIVKTLNKGIGLARGKYIARMDADDISYPKRIEKQVQYLRDNPDIDVCGTWIKTFGEKKYILKLPTKHDQIKADLLFYTPIAHPTVMIKKIVFEQYDYPISFPKAEDYALWIRLINDFQFANLSEPLLYYRLHKNQTSVEYSDVQKQSTLKALSLLLNIFSGSIPRTSIILHERLILNQIVPLDTVEKWLNYLLYQNSKVHFFEVRSLQKSLFKTWKRQAFAQTSNGFSTWIDFYSSPLYLPKNLTLIMHIKFSIKCIVRYSRQL